MSKENWWESSLEGFVVEDHSAADKVAEEEYYQKLEGHFLICFVEIGHLIEYLKTDPTAPKLFKERLTAELVKRGASFRELLRKVGPSLHEEIHRRRQHNNPPSKA